MGCGGCGAAVCHRCQAQTPDYRLAAEDSRGLDNQVLCLTCYDRHGYLCGSCGLRFLVGVECECTDHEDDHDGDDSQSPCDCEDCRTTRSDRRIILPWNWRPEPEFRGNGPLFLGMELEMQIPANGAGYDRWKGNIHNAAETVQGAFGDVVYLKEDGSIGGGFEMVTHPMDYEWAMDNFLWSGLDTATDAGCVAAETCGLHVHVSRAGFRGTSHIYRWMKFVHRNKRQVQTLARRNSSWAKFSPGDRSKVVHYAKGLRRGDRYQAINPLNESTFEMRMFGSSLDRQSVQAALGFADSSVRYAQHIDSQKIIRERAWDWASFYKWLNSQDAYVPLVKEMETLSCVC